MSRYDILSKDIICVCVLAAGRDVAVMSPGQRFMTDLLVSSLMADGGLQSALDAAVKKEMLEIEEKKVKLMIVPSNICITVNMLIQSLLLIYSPYLTAGQTVSLSY